MAARVAEFRRNLSIASCEPCRKSKVGCDHERPCNRCVKRGLQHLCAYRTAEDQGVKTTGPKGLRDETRPGLEYRLRQIERSLQHLQRGLQPSEHSGTSRSSQQPSVDRIIRSTSSPESSSFVLSTELSTTAGPSAPSSVEADSDAPDLGGFEALDLEDHSRVATVSNISLLEEFFSAHDQLKGIINSLPPEQASPQSDSQQSAPAAEGMKFRHSRLGLGMSVLKHFPSLSLCNDLVRVYFNVFHQIRPTVPQHWVGQLLNELFQLQGLAEPRTADGIADAAARVEYGNQNGLSGSGSSSLLNWNTIGVLSSIFAIAAYTAPQLLDTDLLQFYEGLLRTDVARGFAFKMHDIVDLCWQIYDPQEPASESLVLFLYFYFMLHVTFGEYRPLLTHLHGCIVNASARIGLHRESPKAENLPDDIERRRCEYAAIYHMDKILSTFNGTPPLIFRRFGITPLPVAATEAHSFARGQFLVAVAREEVLEMLMTSPRSPQQADVLRLQNLVRARYDAIPAELKYDRKSPLATHDPCLHTHRILLYLFSLENSFVLQNAVGKSNGVLPESQLLKTALAMFSTMVRTWETRAQLSHFEYIMSWLLTTYTSASAGIIFSSILREQTKQASLTDTLPPPLISKSHHLRELRLFLEALSSILPTDPHFESCQKALRIFSRVNEVLLGMLTAKPPDDGTGLTMPTGSEVADGQSSSDDYSSFGLESNSMDFGTLPWLDHVWQGSEEQFMFPYVEPIDFDPVMVDQPAEFVSGTYNWAAS